MKLFALLTVLMAVSSSLVRADYMHERIVKATHMLDARQGSMYPIPNEILAHARGVAIGTITKAGIGIGGQGGEGIVVVRNGPSSWTAPVAYNTSGGSVGAQLGFTTIRYIMILNTPDAVRLFTSPGKMSFDAMATGTAGTDTGTESQTTLALSHRAIIIYKDTGGLYGGATLGGTSVQVKDEVNQEAYGEHTYVRDIMQGKVQTPRSTERLYSLLNGQR